MGPGCRSLNSSGLNTSPTGPLLAGLRPGPNFFCTGLAMQGSISGFYKAPVSKAFFTVIVLASLAVSATRSASLLSLSAKPMFVSSEYWRVISYQFCFATAGELVIGLFLLYQFRLFERHWGSRKFAAFLVLTSLISAVVGFCCLFLSSMISSTEQISPLDSLPLGPYGFVFSCTVQWIFDIPASHSVRVVGIPVTDKSFVYLLAVQLAMSAQPSSVVAAVIGTFAGFCYRISALRNSLVPKSICAMCTKFVLPIIESHPRHPANPPPRQRNREWEMAAMMQNNIHMQQAVYGMMADYQQGGNVGMQQPMLNELHRRAVAQHGNRHVADDQVQEALQMLAGMGFTDTIRNQRLLLQHRGNVQRVLDELLH